MDKRDSFKSRWGFTLACIGSAVGMGNIWMFPTRASVNGGCSFIIPYIIFVVLIGCTGIIGEMSFGRAARSGPIGAFGKALESKGKKRLGEVIGVIPVLGSLAMAIGYTVVVGWIFKYTIGAFTGKTISYTEAGDYAASFGGMATTFGNNGWQIGALLLVTMILVFGVSAGIEKANKIMMPIFFVLFLGLAVYVAFQPGAAAGYSYIFKVDPVFIRDPQVWVFALGQAFFSLSVAGNGTVIYGSYLSDDEDIPSSARNVALFDTIAALLAGLVIIPAMATTGAQLNSGGPGLLFIYLPNLIAGMPGARVIIIVFFVAVFFAGMTSLINLYEAPIATMQEKFHLSRRVAVILIAAVSCVVSILIQGIVSDWMDILSIYICPLGAGLAAIMFFWVGGKKKVEAAVNKGRKSPIGKWFFPLGKYFFTPICFIVLVLGMILGGIG